MDLEFFRNEVKRLAANKGLTIKELLRIIGEQPCLWNSWMRHEIFPNSLDLYKMCQILEVSMEHFFQDERVQVVNHGFENLVKNVINLKKDEMQVLNSLTVDQLKSIINLAKTFKNEDVDVAESK